MKENREEILNSILNEWYDQSGDNSDLDKMKQEFFYGIYWKLDQMNKDHQNAMLNGGKYNGFSPQLRLVKMFYKEIKKLEELGRTYIEQCKERGFTK